MWRDCVANLDSWKISQLLNVMFLFKFPELFLSLVFIVQFLPNNGPRSTFEASPDYVQLEVPLT